MSYSANWRDLISRFGYGFVNDLEQYKFIVKTRAYADMQPRTIGGLGKFRKDPENKKNLDSLLDEIAKDLYSFIEEPAKSEDEFDAWHKEICERFVKKFNKVTEGFSEIAFGKGQKLINCSLKYIYCLKGADEYKEKFEHCHMILDGYTYSEGFYKKEVINAKGTLTRWSNLNYDEYIAIQQKIRDFLKKTEEYVEANGNPLTPFQVEFFVFDKYSDPSEYAESIKKYKNIQ